MSNLPPESVLLYAARQRASLSQLAAATKAGVSERTWAIYEAGGREGPRFRQPRRMLPTTLAKLSRAVGVTPAQLRGSGRPDAAEAYEQIWPADKRDLPQVIADLVDAWPRLDDAARSQLVVQLEPARDWVSARLDMARKMPRQYDLFTA
jgi:transcriptional regulator with XRE-family HTH domain